MARTAAGAGSRDSGDPAAETRQGGEPQGSGGGLKGVRILMLSYHFYPSTAVGARRMSELAGALRTAGAEVIAMAGPASGEGPAVPGVEAVRVSPPRRRLSRLLVAGKAAMRRASGRGKPAQVTQAAAAERPAAAGANTAARESLPRRLRRYWDSLLWVNDDRKLWALKAMAQVRRLSRRCRFDLIISSGPPMSCHLVGWYAARWSGLPWVIDYRDPWVGIESLAWAHIQSPLKRRLEAWQERLCLQRAAAVTCTSAALAQRLRQRLPARGASVSVIHNGYDGELERAPPPLGRLRLLYAGSIYLHRDPGPLIEAIADLAAGAEIDPAKISFEIIGYVQADQRERLSALASRRGVADCVRFEGPLSRRALFARYAGANVLVNLAEGQPQQIPAKMFEYLQLRRDVIVVTEPDSATAALVQGLDWCHLVQGADRAALGQVVRRLYERLVVRREPPLCPLNQVRRYARAASNDAFCDLFRDLLRQRAVR